MKKSCLVCLICVVLLLSGCAKKGDIINISQKDMQKAQVDTKGNEAVYLELDEADGEMTYELIDAWVTSKPEADGVDIGKINRDSYVYMKKTGTDSVPYPTYFKDENKTELIDGCKMLVCKIRVTNINAVSKEKDYYKNPYVFTAGGLFLNYMDENSKSANFQYKNIDYYSLKQDDDHLWSTYELKPGESLTYEVGFIVGDSYLDENSGQLVPFYIEKVCLGGSAVKEDTVYKVEWRES